MDLTIIVTLAFFVASLALLLVSADKFVGGAEEVGLAMGIPPFIMGITILAVGTSFPELITAMYAVSDGSSEIVIGTVIGSNIANILLILGFTALMARSFTITWDLLHGDLPMLFGSVMLLGFVLYPLSDADFVLFNSVTESGGKLGTRAVVTWFEGVVLIVGYVLYLQYYAVRNKEEVAAQQGTAADRPPFRGMSVVWLLLGLVGVMVGAKYTVDHAIDLARILGLGNEVIAASAIAMGTSMPELVVSISAARRNNFEMVIGNVTGSNIFNTFMVLGIPSLAAPFMGTGEALQVGERSILYMQFPYYASTMLLFLVIVLDKTLTRTEGWVIFLAYVLFIGKLFSFF